MNTIGQSLCRCHAFTAFLLYSDTGGGVATKEPQK